MRPKYHLILRKSHNISFVYKCFMRCPIILNFVYGMADILSPSLQIIDNGEINEQISNRHTRFDFGRTYSAVTDTWVPCSVQHIFILKRWEAFGYFVLGVRHLPATGTTEHRMTLHASGRINMHRIYTRMCKDKHEYTYAHTHTRIYIYNKIKVAIWK